MGGTAAPTLARLADTDDDRDRAVLTWAHWRVTGDGTDATAATETRPGGHPAIRPRVAAVPRRPGTGRAGARRHHPRRIVRRLRMGPSRNGAHTVAMHRPTRRSPARPATPRRPGRATMDILARTESPPCDTRDTSALPPGSSSHPASTAEQRAPGPRRTRQPPRRHPARLPENRHRPRRGDRLVAWRGESRPERGGVRPTTQTHPAPIDRVRRVPYRRW
jgi:hypothetical protein